MPEALLWKQDTSIPMCPFLFSGEWEMNYYAPRALFAVRLWTVFTSEKMVTIEYCVWWNGKVEFLNFYIV